MNLYARWLHFCDGIHHRYPLCCVLRFAMSRELTRQAVRRGVCDRQAVYNPWVPCNLLHRADYNPWNDVDGDT